MAERGTGTTLEDGDALRVPRVLRAAEVLCADGGTIRGRLFLPASSEAHAGAMRVEEWMNEPSAFYPFLPDGEGVPVILGKEQTVMITVQAADDTDETLATAPAPLRHVHVECGAVRIEGDVVLDLPDQQTRVLDLLNRGQAFLAIQDGEVHHLVRTSHITRVIETGGAGHDV